MRTTCTVLATAAICFGLSVPALAADHNDAPQISEDPSLDLLDVFAFVSPENPDMVVLALTSNGFTVPGALGIGFASKALYEFKIDNDGDFVEDLVVQATFTPIGGGQQVTVRGPAAPRQLGATSLQLPASGSDVTGPANGSTLTNGDVRVFAGQRDDPFFVDLIWVLRQIGVLPGGPLARPNGIDFLAGLNCTVLVVELPAAELGGSGQTLNIWGTSSRPAVRIGSPTRNTRGAGRFVQADATAFPVVNTVINSALSNSVGLKDAFNRTPPSQQPAQFRKVAIDALVAIGVLNAAQAAGLVDALIIPDVLRLQPGNSAGFPNGRAPNDDVINVVLSAASNGLITTDGVDANDRANPATFPYFAPPHTPGEGVPPRDSP